MDYYSGLKRRELLNYEKTWKKFKCILISEKSQSEKAIYCMVPTICHSEKGKGMYTEKKSVGQRGNEGRVRGAQRIFRDVMLLMVDTCHYAFDQTQRRSNI